MGATMQKVTIKDVATAAGVSVSAVSYILNGSTEKKYSEKTVKAVRKAAERLHYMPNAIARGMRSQRAFSVGIVNFWENGSASFARSLRAVTEAAAERNVSAVLLTGCEDYSYLRAFANRSVDGIVLIAPDSLVYNERAHIREMQKMHVPFAILNATASVREICSVFYDYYAASALAAETLLKSGHKNLLYIDSFSESAARELRERREGYADTVRSAGLLPRMADIEKLTASDLDGVDGVVTSRAETARTLLRFLYDAGIRFPGAFSLIAGSAEEESRESVLPLTCVDFPYAEAGRFAVSAVYDSVTNTRFTPSPFVRNGKTAAIRSSDAEPG